MDIIKRLVYLDCYVYYFLNDDWSTTTTIKWHKVLGRCIWTGKDSLSIGNIRGYLSKRNKDRILQDITNYKRGKPITKDYYENT